MKEAEITIAQCIGEYRRLSFQLLMSTGKFTYEGALAVAESQTEDFFSKLEEAYKTYFENSVKKC